MNMGIISSLPISIEKQRIIFEKYGKTSKFLVGPISSNPGPILLSVVSVAVMFVAKLNPLVESRTNVEINTVK